MKFRNQSIAKWNRKEIPPNFVHEWIEREERKRALRAESAAAAAKTAKGAAADAMAAAADAMATSEAAAAAAVPPTPPPSPPAVTTPMTAAALNSSEAVVSSDSRASRSRSRSERDPSMLVLLWYYPIARKNFLLITFNWDVERERDNFSWGSKLEFDYQLTNRKCTTA